ACGPKIEVVQAVDGLTGLQAATDKRPDLIVMGARMPQLNGIGLCRIFREHGVATPIVILCSSHAGPGEAPRAMAAGANAALQKPVDEGRLRTTMVTLLRERPPGSTSWPEIDAETAPDTLTPRNLEPAGLEAEIARVYRWAEEAGVPVSLVGYEFRFVEGSSTAFIEQFRDVLSLGIRAEDAIAELDDRRLVAVLIDADKEGARAAVRRVHEEMAGAAETFLGAQMVKPKALCRLLTLQPDRLTDDTILPPYVDRLFEEEPRLIEEDATDRPGEPVEKYPLIEAVFHALSGEMALFTSPLDGEVHPISERAEGIRETTLDEHRYRQQDEAEETPAGFRARSGAQIVWVETLEDPPRMVARVEEGRVFRGKQA
ncbi:MAG: response regulator, partial [bacterium]|nr:response regulator [bacterium]